MKMKDLTDKKDVKYKDSRAFINKNGKYIDKHNYNVKDIENIAKKSITVFKSSISKHSDSGDHDAESKKRKKRNY